MLVLGIVSPLVQAAAFLNSMKSMEFAVRDTRHLLDLEELPEGRWAEDRAALIRQLAPLLRAYGRRLYVPEIYAAASDIGQGCATVFLQILSETAGLHRSGGSLRWRQIYSSPAYRSVLGCDGWLHCHRRCGYSESHTEAADGSGQFRDTGQFPL